MTHYLVRCWWLIALALGGCFSPQFEDSKIQCGPNDSCPPGFTCSDGLCRAGSAPKDAGGDGPSAGDPAAPMLTMVTPTSPANANNPVITGTAEAGTTISIFSDVTCTTEVATGTAAELASPGITVAVTDDSSTSFTAKARSAAGRTSPCSTPLTFVEDSTAPSPPSLTSTVPASPSRSILPSVQGTAEAGATVLLYDNETCAGTMIASGPVDTAGEFAISMAVAAATVTRIAGITRDAAGNLSGCSGFLAYEQNASAVSVPLLTSTTPPSPSSSSTTPTIAGSAEAGVVVRLYTDPACSGTVAGTATTDGTGAFSIPVTVGPNTTTTFYAIAEDTSVSTLSACSPVGLTYVHDNVAPPAPTVTGSIPTDPSNDTTPLITGFAEMGVTVALFTDSACTMAAGASGTAADGTYAIEVTLAATTTYYAMATDAAGNTSGCSSTSFQFDYDGVAPVPPSMLATVPGSPSTTNNTPLVTGTAEPNSIVRIYRSADCTGPEAGSGSSSSMTFGIGVTLPTNATTPLSATATDVAGNTSGCSAMVTFTHDSLAPTPPAITMATPASPANMNSPVVSGTAEAGTTVQLYTSSACTTPVGSATVASGAGAFSVTLTVTDNTSTALYARATDAAGNASACSSSAFTYVEDSQPPGAPTLNTLPASSTVTSPNLTGSAEPGTTIKIYASQTCGGTVVAMGTAATGTFGINVTVTANTQTAFSATATDAAGNISPCSTHMTYVHDNMAPNAPAALASNPTSPAGSNTPTITGTAETGTTVRLYTNPTCSTGVAGQAVASGGAFSISLAVQNTSTTTFYATATDAANNASPCSTDFVTYTQDSDAPAPPANLATTPASPSSSQMPTVTGTAEANTTVKLYTSAGCGGAVAFMGTANGAGAFSIPTTVGANTTTTFWATATDSANNASACTSQSVTFTNDALPPGPPVLIASDPGSPANHTTPTITGTAEAGTTVTLYADAGCTMPKGTGTATGGAFSIATTVADNSTTTFYAKATDAAGNASACTTTALTYVEDSMAPGVPTMLATNPVSPASDTTPSITGMAENGATVTAYTLAGCTGTVAGTAVSSGSFAIPISVGANTTTQYYLRATDAAGNQSGCTTSAVIYTEDSLPPSVPVLTSTSPASPANNNNVTVNGTAEAGTTVRLYTAAACTTAIAMGTATGGAFAIGVTPGDNSTTTYYARAFDAAGNQSACTATGLTYVEDSLAPGAPTMLATTPPSPANHNNPSITGSAEAGATVAAFTNSNCTMPAAGSTVAGGSGAFSIPVTVGDNTTTMFYVRATDAAANSSACNAATITYVENSSAVEPPVLVSTTPDSPSNASTSPTVNGTTGPNYTVTLYTNSTCTNAVGAVAVADNGGNFSIGASVTANTTTTFYATANNGINTSACSSGLSYTHDSLPPAAPIGLAVNPASPANNNNPTVRGSAEDGAAITLYTDGACTTPAAGAGTGTATGGTFDIAVTGGVLDNSTTTFYARARDAAGNLSACSAGVSYTEDSGAPAAPTLSSTTPTSPSNTSTSPSVNGTAEAGSTVRIYTTADCSGVPVATGTGGSFSIQVSVGANTTTTFRATATDAAGNTSGCSATFVTYRHDNVAPGAPASLAMNPVGPANNNSPAVTGTAEAGATVTLYKSASCALPVVGTGTALANGTFSVTVTTGAIADNSTTTFYARAADAAGNAGPCSSSSATYIEDSAAPSPPSITSSTPASPSKVSTTPTLSGTAEASSTVKLYTNATCTGTVAGTGTATSGGAFGIAVTVAANSTTTFFAAATDAASNPSGCSATAFTYTHDSAAPATPVATGTTPASPSNVNTPTLNGTAEANATIRVYSNAACTTEISSGTASAAGTFAIPVSVADNSTTSMYVKAVDAAGNASACTTTPVTYIEDSTPPGAPTITATNPASPGNDTTPEVVGTTSEAGAQIRLYSSASCSNQIGSGTSGSGGSFTVIATVLDNTTTSIYATAADVAGNVSACSTVAWLYTADSTPPAAPSGLGTSPASPANENMPMVTGTIEPGTTVQLYTNSACTTPIGAAVTEPTDTFSIAVTVADNASYTFYARATDAAGNLSACSTSFVSYREDSIANPPSFTSTSPVSPSNTSTTPSILGTAEASSTITLYTGAGCATAGPSGPVTASGSFSVAVSVPANSSTTYYGKITDQAGNVSACSTSSITYIHDTVPPAFAGPSSAVATGPSSILVQWPSATDMFTSAAQMRYDVCWKTVPTGACVGTVTTAAGATQYTVTGLNESQRYWFVVRAVDLTGNASAWGGPVTEKTFGPGAIVSVSAGYDHSCALLSDGTVWCWGSNAFGQLGDGTTDDKLTPTPVLGLQDAIAVSAGGGSASGYAHTCALTSDGSVWCWGAGANGELGNGSTAGQTSPVKVSGINNAISVASGDAHTCAVLSKGIVQCWGAGSTGQLGHGSYGSSTTPVDVMSIGNAKAVDLGYRHSCALLADGGVSCWGYGDDGELGDGAATTRNTPTPVAFPPGVRARALDVGAYHACAIADTGNVMCWGANASGQLGDGTTTDATTPVNATNEVGDKLANATAVAAGGMLNSGKLYGTTCVTHATGELRCWGYNASGQLGTGDTTDSSNGVLVTGIKDAVKPAVGTEHSCYLGGAGTVQCFGNGKGGRLGDGDTAGSLVPVPVKELYALEGGVEIAGGGAHTCARRSNGTVVCWGYALNGQTGDNQTTSHPAPGASVQFAGSRLADARDVDTGSAHACAVRADGSVVCWGDNYYGQLGNGSSGSGTNQLEAMTVPGLTNAVQVTTGWYHTCALIADGTIRCWGSNSAGQLGDGSFGGFKTFPTMVSMITTAVQVEALAESTCARLADGTVRCWGRNANGQLGDGTTIDRSTRSSIVLDNATDLSGGGSFACATLAWGEAKCWGNGSAGQMGNGTTNFANPMATFVSGSDYKAITAGRQHACALLHGGTLQCWGQNADGQLGIGSTGTFETLPRTLFGLASILTVGAGDYHTCALHSDGTAECWGLGYDGRLGDGDTAGHQVALPGPVKLFP